MKGFEENNPELSDAEGIKAWIMERKEQTKFPGHSLTDREPGC